MHILKDSITALASEGRVTLQVPDVVIRLDGRSDEDPVDYENLPDEWFCTLDAHGLPTPRGFLFLTRKGWKANRKAIIDTFMRSSARTVMSRADAQKMWDKHANEHFENVRQMIGKKLANLNKQAARLRAASKET